MATGVLGYDEPLNYGLVGMHGNLVTNKAIDEADLLLAIGTRFSDRVALDPEHFASHATIIQIDIDNSEINKNVRVDEYLTGDVKTILTALLPLLEEKTHDDWLARLAEFKKRDYTPKDSDDFLTPHALVRAICEGTDKETIYVTDVGQHQMWAAQYLSHTKSRDFLTSGGLGTMGYGYGAAIGAQIGCPEKRVVHITGDGSFHMNLNEACTAVSNHLPIITVIFDNRVLGMVRQWQTCFYGKRYSQTDPERQTDFVKVIEGFGGKGYHAHTLEEFKAAYKAAQQADGPVWIACDIQKDARVVPMIPAGKTVDSILLADSCATCEKQCYKQEN